MKKINVLFITSLILIFNVVLVYSVVGYIVNGSIWLFPDESEESLIKSKYESTENPMLQDKLEISTEQHNDAGNLGVVSNEAYGDEILGQEALEVQSESIKNASDFKSEVLSEALENSIPESLENIESYGIAAYINNISLADKVAAFAIISKMGSENINQIIRIVENGISQDELIEIITITSDCLTEEDINILADIIMHK